MQVKKEKKERTVTKDIAIIMSIMMCVAYALVDDPAKFGLSHTSSSITRLTYHWLHASIWHLIGNLWVLLTLCFNSRCRLSMLLWSFVIASIVPTFYDKPIIGASGMIYALIGLILHQIWSKRNLVIIVISLALGFFISGVGAYLHAYTFIVGSLLGMVFYYKF